MSVSVKSYGPSLVGWAAAQSNATRTDSTPAPTIVDIAGARLGCPPASGPSMLTPTNELGTFGTARAVDAADALVSTTTSQSTPIATARATMRLIG